MNKGAIGRAERGWGRKAGKGTWKGTTEKASWNNMPTPRLSDEETKAAECLNKQMAKWRR